MYVSHTGWQILFCTWHVDVRSLDPRIRTFQSERSFQYDKKIERKTISSDFVRLCWAATFMSEISDIEIKRQRMKGSLTSGLRRYFSSPRNEIHRGCHRQSTQVLRLVNQTGPCPNRKMRRNTCHHQLQTVATGLWFGVVRDIGTGNLETLLPSTSRRRPAGACHGAIPRHPPTRLGTMGCFRAAVQRWNSNLIPSSSRVCEWYRTITNEILHKVTRGLYLCNINTLTGQSQMQSYKKDTEFYRQWNRRDLDLVTTMFQNQHRKQSYPPWRCWTLVLTNNRSKSGPSKVVCFSLCWSGWFLTSIWTNSMVSKSSSSGTRPRHLDTTTPDSAQTWIQEPRGSLQMCRTIDSCNVVLLTVITVTFCILIFMYLCVRYGVCHGVCVCTYVTRKESDSFGSDEIIYFLLMLVLDKSHPNHQHHVSFCLGLIETVETFFLTSGIEHSQHNQDQFRFRRAVSTHSFCSQI
jgi:hypothetical protein